MMRALRFALALLVGLSPAWAQSYSATEATIAAVPTLWSWLKPVAPDVSGNYTDFGSRGNNWYQPNTTLSADLLTNGDFASNPVNASQSTAQNGWQWSSAGGSSTVSYASGAVTLTSDGTNQARFEPATAITTIVGKTYGVRIDVTATTGGSTALGLIVGTTAGGTTLLGATANTGTSLQYGFTATTTTSYLRIQRTVAGASTIDNVSVRLLQPTQPTLTTNGIISGRDAYTFDGTTDNSIPCNFVFPPGDVSVVAVVQFPTGTSSTDALNRPVLGSMLPGSAFRYFFGQFNRGARIISQAAGANLTGTAASLALNTPTLIVYAWSASSREFAIRVNGGAWSTSTISTPLNSLSDVTCQLGMSTAASSTVFGSILHGKMLAGDTIIDTSNLHDADRASALAAYETGLKTIYGIP